jgi:hypothetical protein
MIARYLVLILCLFLIVPVSATEVPEFADTERPTERPFGNLVFVSVLMTINDTIDVPDADREQVRRVAFAKNVEQVATAFVIYERFDYSRSLDDVLRDRRGDCSEIAMLETAMLNVVGIKSQIVNGVLVWDATRYPTKRYRIPLTRYAMEGHAWVETEDGIVLGNPADNTTVWSCELVRFPGARMPINDITSMPDVLTDVCQYWQLSTGWNPDRIDLHD